MRIVLLLAAACVAILGLLFLFNRAEVTSTPVKKEAAPAVQEAAKPALAKAPEPPPKAPEAKPAPVDDQVAEDAAAVGMTTREPPPDSPPPIEPPQ